MFFPGSPLNYPTNALGAIRRYKADRVPTEFDGSIFSLGDEWLDVSADKWYKLVSKTGGVAVWCQLCSSGGGGTVEEFLPDSGTSPVVPNGAGQVTVTGGPSPRDIEVVGGLNELTFELNSSLPGDRCFTCPSPSTAEFCWDCTDACTSLRGIPTGFTGSEWITCQDGVQTLNAASTPIATITLTDPIAMTVKAFFTGTRADHSAALAGDITFGARRAGGGAIALSTPVVNILDDGAASLTITADVSGNDVRLLVTGEAGTTWNWVTTYSYQFLNTNA